ncbi:hypothetical protein [uncultured Tateyamaria sp.]|uniref:hypothetical protein n=1 Tax=uncultured Tateyamaria sp. TaxID=455651 RepID=UPI00344D3775
MDGDFRVRSVSRDDTAITMSLELLDERIVALANTDRDLFGRIMTTVIAKEICSDRDARALFNSGFKLNIRFLSARGRPLFTSAINRC